MPDVRHNREMAILSESQIKLISLIPRIVLDCYRDRLTFPDRLLNREMVNPDFG